LGKPPFPPNPPAVVAEIAFEAGKPQITVTVGEKVTRFPIDANEERAFISYGGHELTADEFTKIALEPVLFAPPKAAAKHASHGSGTAFS